MNNKFLTYKKSIAALLALLLAVLSGTLLFGAFPISCKELLQVLSPFSESEGMHGFLIWEVRLPRVLLGLVIGGVLSISGAALQGLFRNPLADPSLIGVMSGSMLAAVFGIVAVNRGLVAGPDWVGMSFVFCLSVLGGWGVTWLIYRLATRQGYTSVSTMLLAGIAIAALAGAMTGLLTYFSEEKELRTITFWTMGSLASGAWKNVIFLGVIGIGGGYGMFRIAPSLDILALGEQEAYYMGVDVQMVKRQIILLAAVLIGPCVAVGGLIGFVALVIPHLMRSLGLGRNHRQLFISSSIGGGILLMAADAFARTAIAPSELPIGVLTALIGGPYFLWLLCKNGARGW